MVASGATATAGEWSALELTSGAHATADVQLRPSLTISRRPPTAFGSRYTFNKLVHPPRPGQARPRARGSASVQQPAPPTRSSRCRRNHAQPPAGPASCRPSAQRSRAAWRSQRPACRPRSDRAPCGGARPGTPGRNDLLIIRARVSQPSMAARTSSTVRKVVSTSISDSSFLAAISSPVPVFHDTRHWSARSARVHRVPKSTSGARRAGFRSYHCATSERGPAPVPAPTVDRGSAVTARPPKCSTRHPDSPPTLWLWRC